MKLIKLFTILTFSTLAFAQDDEVTTLDDDFFEETTEGASRAESNDSEFTTQNNGGEEVTVLSDLSVDGEGINESAPADTKTKAESVKVMNTQELQGSSSTIADATNRSSGVKVKQSGGMGSDAKISIRGMEGKNVKVLVNGVPVENGSGSLSINDIPIDMIDRIEVYKSYVPERFATDGMGGVINVITRNMPKSCISASYSFGSFNTHKVSLDAKYVYALDSLKGRAIETGVSSYLNYSDNDYKFTTPYMDTTVTRDHDRYYSYSVSPYIALDNYFFDKITLGGSYNIGDKEVQAKNHKIVDAHGEFSGWGINAGIEKQDLFFKGLALSLGVSFERSNETFIDTSHTYHYGWTDDDVKKSKRSIGEIRISSPAWDEFVNTSVKVPWNVDYQFTSNHSINWSGLYKYDHQDPTDKLSDGGRQLSTAGFPGYNYSVVSGLSLEDNFWNSHIQNIIGVKGYYYKLDAEDDAVRLQKLKSGAVSRKNIGYSENLKFQIVEQFSIRGGYQHSLRFPTHEEIFGDGMYINIAPALKPEVSDNFTAGADIDLKHIPLILKGHLEFNYFYMLLDDRIYLNTLLSSIPRPYYNSVGTKTKGLEIDANVDVNEYLNLSWNMTSLEVKSREADPSYGIGKNWNIPNIPLFYMNFGVELHAGDLFNRDDFLKIYWNANYTDEYYYAWKVSNKQERIIPSSFSQNIGIEYSIFANMLSWNFEVTNFMDRMIYDSYGDSKPGRAFSTKIRLNL